MIRAISEQDQAARNLWAAVLHQTRMDILQGRKKLKSEDRRKDARLNRDKAKAWMINGSTSPGSFKWICTALDLHPDIVRKEMLK